MLLLIAALTFAPLVFSNIEAHNHLLRIITNNNRNSLRGKFHGQALAWRIVFMVGGGGVLIGLNAIDTGLLLWQVYLGWVPYAFTLFGYDFTRRLNRLRSEVFPDYGITTWYVSKQPAAAWSDRQFVLGSRKFNRGLAFIRLKTGARLTRYLTTPEALARIVYTAAVVVGFALFVAALLLDKWL